MIGKNRSRCFLDVDIENEHVGRIIIELFDDICPITCENFRFLCTGEKGFGPTTKKPLHYKNTLFHRVVKNFVIQGGDFVHGDGRGGESIYGGQFKDENFNVLHDQPFMLSMANRGKDSNGSQFFITTQAAPHLDGLHTVFGKVVSGKEVVTLIEDIETDSSNRPLRDVKISNCGEMVLQVKQKEKKKRREYATESSGSESDSDESHRKKKKKRKHSKKHKREKKDRKILDSSAGRDEEDLACGVDPEEIPSIPTNKFLLRNTSPLPEGSRRNNMPRERDSYSFHRRPSRSKSGRKIKGRGFMRYRTPSPEGSRSGSETPPHWKQEQSRLRKMPEVITTKEQVSEDSQSQQDEMDEEMAIRNSMFQSRLGLIPKQTDDTRENRIRKHSDAVENRRSKEWSNDEYRSLKEQKHMMFKQFLTESEDRQKEKKFQNRDPYYNDTLRSSPLRSKIVKSREYEDKFSDRRQARDDRRYQTEFVTEKKNSESQFEQKHDYSYDRINKNALQKTGKENNSKKGSEQSVKSMKNFKALRSDLLRYVDVDVDVEENKPEKKIENKIEKRNVFKKNAESKKNFKALKSDLLRYVDFDPDRNDTPKKKKIESKNVELEKKDATVPLDKEKDVANPVDKEQETKSPSFEQTANQSPKLNPNNSSALESEKNNEFKAHSPELPPENENSITDKVNMHSNLNETIGDSEKMDTVDVEEICLPSVSEDLNLTSSNFIQDSARNQCVDHDKSVENLQNSSGQHNPLKLLECSMEVTNDSYISTNAPFDTIIPESGASLAEIQSESPTELTDRIPCNGAAPIMAQIVPLIWMREEEKNSDHENQPMKVDTTDEKLESERPISPAQRKSPPRPQTPPTPDFSVKQKKNSPNRKYDRSSRSSSSSPVKRRRNSKSPVERVASSSKRRRSSVERRSKSPVHKYKSTSAQRTNRSTARISKSRSRSRSGSISPRDRRRRKSRSPVTRVRRSRSRSRPRNERGSQFYRYQSFRNRSPDRRGAYYRQYNKSPSYRGRSRGGAHRSRSRSPARRRRRQRRSSSSSSSSSSRNSSSSDNNKSKKSHRDRKKHRSSSSSSSSKNSRSDSDSD